ncbi:MULTISPECIES: PPC domain-containing protein [Nostoc]|uniref:Pre-peptidase C-terminal domain-containing protein n=1 Tax=Nostoc paludosum FACHB-159 TaxID=2692908 RepID=A0ABR8K483_9NOSO|nr:MULTISPECIES: PPC domain-containing protein [Nostoc]MBD2677382.1 pre-peptidase C-terminal domain-containing protein [Nostoc sp. FACHB-857]MBD2734225.1 pre-peptidase C-terminal domain-containing protein [Nostoc paludosum FACHB-159]
MATFNLGSIGTTPVVRNNFSLTTSDPTDVFKFQISGTKNINLSLTDISTGDDAELFLFRDNGNGIFDSGDQLVDFSTNSSNRDESLNNRESTGTYFAQVRRFAPGSSGTVTYDLSVSATTPNSTAGFSNLLPKEFDLGNLSGDVTRSSLINDSDTTDTYHFSLGFFEGVNIRLSGLLADADIRLVQDSNNNRIVDAGEEIARSTNGGTAADLISNINLSGDYFLQVQQFSGNTGYSLNFDHFTTTFA